MRGVASSPPRLLMLAGMLAIVMSLRTRMCAAQACEACLGAGRAYCSAHEAARETCVEPSASGGAGCNASVAEITNLAECPAEAENEDSSGDDSDGENATTEESSLLLGHVLLIVAFAMGTVACVMYVCCLYFTVDFCCAPRKLSVGVASTRSFQSNQSLEMAPSARSHRHSSAVYTVGNDIEVVQAVSRLCE